MVQRVASFFSPGSPVREVSSHFYFGDSEGGGLDGKVQAKEIEHSGAHINLYQFKEHM